MIEPTSNTGNAGDASSTANTLPSVAITARFLSLCEHYGAERLAVSIIASGRSTGVPGLPQHNRWADWNAGEMQTAVEYLERQCAKK
ncbi:MAG: hypothetical protein OXQ28_13985 [Acidobacteriota bacterium]|nr:hypothetical protein [Acidobacteriota bacterium]